LPLLAAGPGSGLVALALSAALALADRGGSTLDKVVLIIGEGLLLSDEGTDAGMKDHIRIGSWTNRNLNLGKRLNLILSLFRVNVCLAIFEDVGGVEEGTVVTGGSDGEGTRLVKGRGRGLPPTLFIISCAVRNIELSLHFRVHAISNGTLVYCQAMRTVRPTFELDLNKSEEAADHKPGSGIDSIATEQHHPKR
jgi:hypothetical protein